MPSVLNELQRIIRITFIDPELVIDRETTASDVPGWDSLSHVRLVLTIEKAFEIKFIPREVSSFSNVGELSDIVEQKLLQGAGDGR